MKELAEQIDFHIEVIDMDNPTSNVAPEGLGNSEINLAPKPPNFWRSFPYPFYNYP